MNTPHLQLKNLLSGASLPAGKLLKRVSGKALVWTEYSADSRFAVATEKSVTLAGIGDYAIFSTYGSGLYGGLPTLIFNNAGNDKLTWETSLKTDVGFSFGLFKDRLTGDFAYYKNDISDLILNVPQSPSTGVPNTIPTNVGSMYNKGIEISLTGVPVKTKDFTWTSTLNFSQNKNHVTSLAPGLTEILTATSGLETVSRTAVGYSAGYLWLVRNGGVDPATGRTNFIK